MHVAIGYVFVLILFWLAYFGLGYVCFTYINKWIKPLKK